MTWSEITQRERLRLYMQHFGDYRIVRLLLLQANHYGVLFMNFCGFDWVSELTCVVFGGAHECCLNGEHEHTQHICVCEEIHSERAE